MLVTEKIFEASRGLKSRVILVLPVFLNLIRYEKKNKANCDCGGRCSEPRRVSNFLLIKFS